MFLFKKGAFFKRTKVAFFISNSFERRSESVDLPFVGGVKDQSDLNAIALMRAIKRYDYWPSFIMVLLCFAIFLCLSYKQTDFKVNLDLAALVYTILLELQIFFNKRDPLLKMKIKGRIIYIYKDVVFKGIQEVLVFGISLLISYLLRFMNFPSEWLSKFSIAILFLCILIDMWKKEQ